MMGWRVEGRGEGERVGDVQVLAEEPDSKEVHEEGCCLECQQIWTNRGGQDHDESVHMRNPRKKRRVMGCELRRQLRSPWRG